MTTGRAIAILFIIGITLSNCISGKAQQYKFKWCNNYHFDTNTGTTINEAKAFGDGGMDSIVVNLTNDSIEFSVPAISCTEQTAFQIEKREENQDDRGDKQLLIVVSAPAQRIRIDDERIGHVEIDDRAKRIVISVRISRNSLSTSFEK